MVGFVPSELQVVREYVAHERVARGVKKLRHSSAPETSGFGYDPGGEIGLLLDRQLIPTSEGYGGWNELDDPKILRAVCAEIMFRQQSNPTRNRR
jgi:hypothetical protein